MREIKLERMVASLALAPFCCHPGTAAGLLRYAPVTKVLEQFRAAHVAPHIASLHCSKNLTQSSHSREKWLSHFADFRS